jgi:uncharacterized protein (DUF1501 family)
VTFGGVESYLSWADAVALLPALSVQLPETDALLASGPAYAAGLVHDAIPDVASLADAEKVTACEYQPFESGGRDGVKVTAGGVASYFNANEPAALFPAASTQLPATLAVALSGPEYVALEHVSTPDVASLPPNETATGWLNQPFASGARAALAVTVGGVESYLNV